MKKVEKSEKIPLPEFAKTMRLQPTKAEAMLYSALLTAFSPYRATVHAQEPVGVYIADFYIAPSNIVVEVDGPTHDDAEQKEHDKRRNTFMRRKGIRVMRFKNRQVFRSPKAVAECVLNQCLPLPLAKDGVKVTICPPGSAKKYEPRFTRKLWWVL